MKSRIAVALLASSLITGCQQVGEMSYTDYRSLAVQKNKDCEAQGVKAGTKEMENCVIWEMRREDAKRQNNKQRRMMAAAAMANAGAQMQENARNQQMINSMNRPVNCTSSPGMNGTVRTNCY